MSGRPRLPTGVVDMHVHSSPDVRPRLMSDLEVSRAAASACYRAVVLKSHHSSTAGRAGIAEEVVPELRVIGGIALNHAATGGLNAAAVEATALTGGRVVWMPTFNARNHVAYLEGPGRGGHLEGIGRTDTIVDVVDAQGALLPGVLSVLDAVAEHGMTLATGHLGPLEIMLLVPEARRRGVQRVVVTHPEMEVVDLPIESQVELAALGGVWFERVAVITRRPFDYSVARMAEAIRAVGVGSTVLSTDLGQPSNPPPVQGLEEFVAAIRDAGFTSDEVESMTCSAPAAALALEEAR